MKNSKIIISHLTENTIGKKNTHELQEILHINIDINTSTHNQHIQEGSGCVVEGVKGVRGWCG